MLPFHHRSDVLYNSIETICNKARFLTFLPRAPFRLKLGNASSYIWRWDGGNDFNGCWSALGKKKTCFKLTVYVLTSHSYQYACVHRYWWEGELFRAKMDALRHSFGASGWENWILFYFRNLEFSPKPGHFQFLPI